MPPLLMVMFPVTVSPVEAVVVPAEKVMLLKLVKMLVGSVLDALNCTVPVPAVNTEPVAFETARLCTPSVPPAVIVMVPLLPAPLLPIVTAPATVRVRVALKVSVPLVAVVVLPSCRLAIALAGVRLRVMLFPPSMVTFAVAVC